MTDFPHSARSRPSPAMPDSRLVAVLIPHYGDPRPTQDLVAQLVRDPQVCEVIVVDDCSPDPLPPIPGATVVRRPENGGFGAAVNTGVGHVRAGELVLILNSDVSVAPDFVRNFVERAAPWQPALAAPRVITNGRDTLTARRFPRARHQVVERIKLLHRWQGRTTWNRLIGQDVRAVADKDLAVDWVAGVAMLVPTNVLRQVGGFDERYHMYAEEVDLQRRLAELGVPRVFLGSLSLEHVGGASTDPSRAAVWLVRSRLAYAWKWGGYERLRTVLSLVMLLNVLSELIRKALGRDVRPSADLLMLRHVWANDLTVGTRRLSLQHNRSENELPTHE